MQSLSIHRPRSSLAIIGTLPKKIQAEELGVTSVSIDQLCCHMGSDIAVSQPWRHAPPGEPASSSVSEPSVAVRVDTSAVLLKKVFSEKLRSKEADMSSAGRPGRLWM